MATDGAPAFWTAFRFWLKLGFINFGGPAGQIAMMHEELVERRKWISNSRFLHALNYCMLLPGPEAMQLATYVGWLLHGTGGGLAAGALFVLPGALLMLGLSILYGLYGRVPWVGGIFYGFGPAVIAIVAAAVIRIGKKGLHNPALITLAAAAFIAIFFFGAPFPAIVGVAALVGFAGSRWRPDWFKPGSHAEPGGDAAIADHHAQLPHTQPSAGRFVRVLAVHLVLWGAPLAAIYAWRGPKDPLFQLGLFFSIASMVTFGGAYAVLAYVAKAATETYDWLRPGDMTVGLGLAESTPGPLILVVQWVGYLGAMRHAPAGWSPVAAGVLGAALTLWVTFVPCFLWIFLGAPFIERLRGNRTLDGMLTAVTAIVVGVILNLAIWLALRVVFHAVDTKRLGPLILNVPQWRTIDWIALAAAVVGFVGIVRFKWNMIAVVLAYAGLGLVYRGFTSPGQ